MSDTLKYSTLHDFAQAVAEICDRECVDPPDRPIDVLYESYKFLQLFAPGTLELCAQQMTGEHKKRLFLRRQENHTP